MEFFLLNLYSLYTVFNGRVAELADAYGLGPYAFWRVGFRQYGGPAGLAGKFRCSKISFCLTLDENLPNGEVVR